MKILFLAKYAPNFEVVNIESIERKTVEYHKQIYDAIIKLGHSVVATDDFSHLLDNSAAYDLVWSLLKDETRDIQMLISSLCNKFNVKYVGASSTVRALMLDKSLSKILAKHLEIPTSEWIIASKSYPEPKNPPFEGPYFVKPRFGGASIGIDETCLAYSYCEVKELAKQFYSSDVEIIIEKYIEGTEYGVPVLNSNTRDIIVGIPIKCISLKKGRIVTFNQKNGTEDGLFRELSDDEQINEWLSEYAQKFFLESQPCDYARIDFIIDQNDGKPYFLETNPLMLLMKGGLTEKSLLSDQMRNYEDIIEYIIDIASKKISF